MAEPQQKFTITVPRSFTAIQRTQVGDLAIDKIRERTAKGKSLKGGKFKGYSDSYKESKDFKIAGKTNTVNLELSSEMMLDIEILGHGTGFVTIGFEADSFSNDKASWQVNNTAHSIKRPFLGLTKAETKEIVSQVQGDALETGVRRLLERAESGQDEAANQALGSFLKNILGGG